MTRPSVRPFLVVNFLFGTDIFSYARGVLALATGHLTNIIGLTGLHRHLKRQASGQWHVIRFGM